MKKQEDPKEMNAAQGLLPIELVEDLQAINPWWQGKPGTPIPRFRRWAFARLMRLVEAGLTQATILRGPRRVGKTILLRQVIEELLHRGVAPTQILYVPFDATPGAQNLIEPILQMARWFERQVVGRSFNEQARDGLTTYLFFDEVQNLNAWAPQLKHLVDNHAVRVLLTGSSSLQIELGRDSLAGRVTTVELGPLLLREIAELRLGHVETGQWPGNGSEELADSEFWRHLADGNRKTLPVRRQAFELFSRLGGYPVAHENPSTEWPDIADYLVETVIQRVLQHDIPSAQPAQRMDTHFIEGVFRLACRYAGQAPGPAAFVPDIHTILGQFHSWASIRRALHVLESTLLLRLVEPLELRLKRQTAPAKLCLCDHALRAAWLQETVPLDAEGLAANPHLSDLAGRLAESTLGYFLASIPNLDVAHFPERGAEPEVDFVVTIGTKRIPIEVNYRKRIDALEDTRGLRAFLEKSVYNAPFGLLVTLEDEVRILDPRIIPISLSSFLWTR